MNEDKTANQRTSEMAPHYDKGEGAEQHWDRAWKLYGEAWFVLNVTKYVERYKGKNGIADLRKAQHYLQKLIELETAAEAAKKVSTDVDPRKIFAEIDAKVREHLANGTGAVRERIVQDGHGFGHLDMSEGGTR